MSNNQKHNIPTVYNIPEFSFKPGMEGHTIIFGPTSSGKTMASNVLQGQMLAAGGVVRVMDVGLSSEAFKRRLGK